MDPIEYWSGDVNEHSWGGMDSGYTQQRIQWVERRIVWYDIGHQGSFYGDQRSTEFTGCK